MSALNVDHYLAWRFDLVKRNCWHLTQAAWLDLTGNDLGDRTPDRITAATLSGRFDTDVPEFTRLPAAADPCIVLMRAPGSVPHVGVFYRGRVLQMTSGGASFLPLPVATRGYPSVEFYR